MSTEEAAGGGGPSSNPELSSAAAAAADEEEEVVVQPAPADILLSSDDVDVSEGVGGTSVAAVTPASTAVGVADQTTPESAVIGMSAGGSPPSSGDGASLPVGKANAGIGSPRNKNAAASEEDGKRGGGEGDGDEKDATESVSVVVAGAPASEDAGMTTPRAVTGDGGEVVPQDDPSASPSAAAAAVSTTATEEKGRSEASTSSAMAEDEKEKEEAVVGITTLPAATEDGGEVVPKDDSPPLDEKKEENKKRLDAAQDVMTTTTTSSMSEVLPEGSCEEKASTPPPAGGGATTASPGTVPAARGAVMAEGSVGVPEEAAEEAAITTAELPAEAVAATTSKGGREEEKGVVDSASVAAAEEGSGSSSEREREKLTTMTVTATAKDPSTGTTTAGGAKASDDQQERGAEAEEATPVSGSADATSTPRPEVIADAAGVPGIFATKTIIADAGDDTRPNNERGVEGEGSASPPTTTTASTDTVGAAAEVGVSTAGTAERRGDASSKTDGEKKALAGIAPPDTTSPSASGKTDEGGVMVPFTNVAKPPPFADSGKKYREGILRQAAAAREKSVAAAATKGAPVTASGPQPLPPPAETETKTKTEGSSRTEGVELDCTATLAAAMRTASVIAAAGVREAKRKAPATGKEQRTTVARVRSLSSSSLGSSAPATGKKERATVAKKRSLSSSSLGLGGDPPSGHRDTAAVVPSTLMWVGEDVPSLSGAAPVAAPSVAVDNRNPADTAAALETKLSAPADAAATGASIRDSLPKGKVKPDDGRRSNTGKGKRQSKNTAEADAGGAAGQLPPSQIQLSDPSSTPQTGIGPPSFSTSGPSLVPLGSLPHEVAARETQLVATDQEAFSLQQAVSLPPASLGGVPNPATMEVEGDETTLPQPPDQPVPGGSIGPGPKKKGRPRKSADKNARKSTGKSANKKAGKRRSQDQGQDRPPEMVYVAEQVPKTALGDKAMVHPPEDATGYVPAGRGPPHSGSGSFPPPPVPSSGQQAIYPSALPHPAAEGDGETSSAAGQQPMWRQWEHQHPYYQQHPPYQLQPPNDPISGMVPPPGVHGRAPEVIGGTTLTPMMAAQQHPTNAPGTYMSCPTADPHYQAPEQQPGLSISFNKPSLPPPQLATDGVEGRPLEKVASGADSDGGVALGLVSIAGSAAAPRVGKGKTSITGGKKRTSGSGRKGGGKKRKLKTESEIEGEGAVEEVGVDKKEKRPHKKQKKKSAVASDFTADATLKDDAEDGEGKKADHGGGEEDVAPHASPEEEEALLKAEAEAQRKRDERNKWRTVNPLLQLPPFPGLPPLSTKLLQGLPPTAKGPYVQKLIQDSASVVLAETLAPGTLNQTPSASSETVGDVGSTGGVSDRIDGGSGSRGRPGLGARVGSLRLGGAIAPDVGTFIPHGAEIWKLSELYFPVPDTFPIEYYMRLLGLTLREPMEEEDMEGQQAKHREEESRRRKKEEEDKKVKVIVGEDGALSVKSEATSSMGGASQRAPVPSSSSAPLPAKVEDGASATGTEKDSPDTKTVEKATASSGREQRQIQEPKPRTDGLMRLEQFSRRVTRVSKLGNDPFFDIPPLGSFATQVLRKSRRPLFRRPLSRDSGERTSHEAVDNMCIESLSDDELDYSDPVWSYIQSNYRGYTDETFLLPGGNKIGSGTGGGPGTAATASSMQQAKRTKAVSADVLSFARDCGFLRLTSKGDIGDTGEIEFRYATTDDLDILYGIHASSEIPIHSRGTARIKTRAEINHALRNPCEFFLLAFYNGKIDRDQIQKEHPIGYVHYCFYWYKILENSRVVSELTVFVDHIAMINPFDCVPSSEDARFSEKMDGQASPKAKDGQEDGSIIELSGSSENTQSKEEWQNPEVCAADERTRLKSIGEAREGPLWNGFDMERCEVLLIALALEHARACGVWFGFLDAAPSMVPMLRHYFRMSVLSSPHIGRRSSTQEQGAEGKRSFNIVPMACDLKKCSFRYAFLCLKETGEDNMDADVPICESYRMLIRLPTRKQAQLFLETRSTDNEAREDGPETLEKLNSDHQGTLVTVAPSPHPKSPLRNERSTTNSVTVSVNQSLWNKVVAVRLDIGSGDSQTDEDAVRIFPLNWSTSGSEINGTEISGRETLLKEGPERDLHHREAAGWNVVKVFPLARSLRQADGIGSVDAEPERDLVEELKNKQKQLMDFESSMELVLFKLLNSVVKERVDYECPEAIAKRQGREEVLAEYEAVLARRREADLAWQEQLEQDMDAVCDICADGEVTPSNQILFCESCNVAVHQRCYGIKAVPAGDYFCRACIFFGRDQIPRSHHLESGEVAPRAKPGPLPIVCELCCRKQGAFDRTHNPRKSGRAKWAHVVCAKWQGLLYTNPDKVDELEDVSELKNQFMEMKVSCCLCLSGRGAFLECRHEGCEKWMHITCARAVGTCNVVHGETHDGSQEEKDAWTLSCPEHSTVDPAEVRDGSLSVEQLVEMAKSFPPDEKPKPKPKAFSKMTKKERDEFLNDSDYEAEFIETISSRLEGCRCSVCNAREDGFSILLNAQSDGTLQKTSVSIPVPLSRCDKCGIVVHRECYITKPAKVDKDNEEFTCDACRYCEQNDRAKAEYERPCCHMCNQGGGTLKKAFAIPMSMKKWKLDMDAYKRSMFGRRIWCHSACGMWSKPSCLLQEDTQEFDCTAVIMSNGRTHVNERQVCGLCCRHDKVKVPCSNYSCRAWGEKRGPFRFHISCARQAGLEVADTESRGEVQFTLSCFKHVKSEHVLRAKLEDMLETEKTRGVKGHCKNMNLTHASRLHQWAINIMQCLGWSWRWAEWWVEFGDNWEPLLEPGEIEENMTNEQLGRVESTRESRCADARKCRLAAFGAALRNREYDKEEGDDRVAIDRALRAILHVPSLVGPLRSSEIDLFAEWLARAYRSNSILLGFGDDKIPVADDGRCLHIVDGSPKYKLGNRPLPGKQKLKSGEFFESGIEEADDFLIPEDFGNEDVGKKKKAATKKSAKAASKKAKVRARVPSRRKRRSTEEAVEETEVSGDAGASITSKVRGDGEAMESNVTQKQVSEVRKYSVADVGTEAGNERAKDSKVEPPATGDEPSPAEGSEEAKKSADTAVPSASEDVKSVEAAAPRAASKAAKASEDSNTGNAQQGEEKTGQKSNVLGGTGFRIPRKKKRKLSVSD